jgi:hypothetical protein
MKKKEYELKKINKATKNFSEKLRMKKIINYKYTMIYVEP